MRRNKILLNATLVVLSFILIMPAAFAKQVWQNSPATEYDGLGSTIINNCVLFARYKVPSLPYGLISYESKKNICNSNTAIVGEIAVLPQYSGGYYGHVAYVEKVEGSTITILEGGANTGHINRRRGTESQLEIYGYYNPGGLSNPSPNPSSNNLSVSIAEGTYKLVPRCATGSALDINGGSSDTGANVQIWSQNDTNAQKFNISQSGSAYVMKALCSGKVLDVYNGATSDGTNVWQYDSNGTAAQKWYFENAGDGYYYIKSELGKYLDVNGGESSDGTNVQIWSFNGTDAQKWRIISVSYSNDLSSNTKTGVIRGTDGSLVINSQPKAGYDIGYIPEGASCKVYPDKQSGNWYWVSYNGVSGYSYGKYIIINSSGTSAAGNNSSSKTRTGIIRGTDGSLVINSRPKAGYDIGYIPEGASCTVYPDKQSGNWYWVSYNGVSGYSYGKYIILQ